MSVYAPEAPTTEDLSQAYPLLPETAIEIALSRERIGGILSGRAEGLVAIVGPCAMTDQVEVIAAEGERLKDVTAATQGLYVAHRMPVWKPRTNPQDWHGRETTDPEGAYATLVHQANHGTGVSIEIAHLPQAVRYADATVFDWFGGRNIDNRQMMEEVALHSPDLPFAVKNGLDGTIDTALAHVAHLNEIRGPEAAPVVLLYRGGENAKDPEAWERQYRNALETTAGRMIVDIAHGSEMAHDPKGNFKKSAAGQEAAMEHVLAIAKTGIMPAGIMAEASEANSPTDPHMRFETAVQGILRLHALRHAVTLSI